jgi:transcriptional regulator with XRE-family HTH domain
MLHMDNGQRSGEEPRKKRGRPPGARKALSEAAHLPSGDVLANGAITALAEQTPAGDGQPDTIVEARLSPLSKLLHSILHHDRAEITHVAKAMEVTENTIYRWMSGSSEPRPAHLKRLPEVFPEHRATLIYAINQAFPGLLDMSLIGVREVPREIYQRVAELITANEEEEARFWQVSEAIFEQALLHLDTERRGLAITYARLMPARADGIHALREFTMRGNAPWGFNNEAKVYLGSTTLAGTAAMLQRVQIWSDIEEGRLQVEADEFEHSACAAPLLRGSRIAGVLIVSSTRSNFFLDPIAYQAVSDYAQLLATALRDQDFYPVSQLNLRPMANLTIQRDYIARTYVNRILTHVRKQGISRREAEQQVQDEMEREFEEWGRLSKAEQRQRADQA